MRLNQVTLPAGDLPGSIAFYKRLGLRLIVQSEHYARFECPDGESTFSLHLEPGYASDGKVVIYFEHDELNGLIERLKSKGVVFEQEPQDQRWLWREAYVRDPSGHRICLFHAGEARRYPPWRLKD